MLLLKNLKALSSNSIFAGSDTSLRALSISFTSCNSLLLKTLSPKFGTVGKLKSKFVGVGRGWKLKFEGGIGGNGGWKLKGGRGGWKFEWG